jgi:hypothetical protein
MPLIGSLVNRLCNLKLQYLILLSIYGSMKETAMTDHFSDDDKTAK